MKKGIMAKESLAILAGTLFTVGLLTACGSSQQEAATTAAEETTVTETETETENAQAESPDEIRTITAATKGSPTPYMTIDENNELQGSDIDIIRAVFDRLPQYDLEIVVTDDPLTGLTSGLYDIAVNNYGWREERGETYYYSYPYKFGFDVYIQRIDDEPLTGLQDLADRGYKTEVGAGSLKASALEAWNAENPDHQINIIYAEVDFQTKFRNILDGKTDVAIDDGPILDTLIEQFGMEDDLVGNEIDADTLAFISPHNGSYFLLAKDEKGAALREDVNTALKELKEDGTLAEITTKYFGKDTSPALDQYESTLN